MAGAVHVRATDLLTIFLAICLAGCSGFAPLQTHTYHRVGSNARRITELSIHPESSFLLSGEISNALEYGTQAGRESIQVEQLDSTTTIIGG